MTKIAFEKDYSDGSGVQYAVRLDMRERQFEIESISIARLPLEELNWVIECLTAIRNVVEKQ